MFPKFPGFHHTPFKPATLNENEATSTTTLEFWQFFPLDAMWVTNGPGLLYIGGWYITQFYKGYKLDQLSR